MTIDFILAEYIMLLINNLFIVFYFIYLLLKFQMHITIQNVCI